MGVLAAAGGQQRQEQSSGDAGQSEDSVDLVRLVTGWLEDFISGLAFHDGRVQINWSILNPMASAIAALGTIIQLGGVL